MEAKEAFEVVRLLVGALGIRGEDASKVEAIVRLLAQIEHSTISITQQLQQLQKEKENDA